MKRKILTEGCPLDRAPSWIRELLDSWRFWFTVALAGVVLSIVLGYKALDKAIHDENSRQAAAYSACVASRPELAKIGTFLHGVNVIAGEDGILVRNALAVLVATAPSDPQYAPRKANLVRLERGAREVSAVKALPVPTLAQCLLESRNKPAQPPAPAASQG